MLNRSSIVAIVAWVRAYLVDDELSGVGPEQARFLNRLRALPSSARHTVTPAWLRRATRREQRTRTRTKRGQRYRRGSGERGRGKVLIDNASHVFALVPLRSTVGAKGKLHHCGGGGGEQALRRRWEGTDGEMRERKGGQSQGCTGSWMHSISTRGFGCW